MTSFSGICEGIVVRDFSVEVCVSGTHATIAGSIPSGSRTTSPDALAVTPPYNDAATLSG
ncbi:MAG: hypothetical protein EBT09_10900 [Actinobacteria bacterium]|nr:hypothetical protein [Actinomycetota bacterium]